MSLSAGVGTHQGDSSELLSSMTPAGEKPRSTRSTTPHTLTHTHTIHTHTHTHRRTLTHTHTRTLTHTHTHTHTHMQANGMRVLTCFPACWLACQPQRVCFSPSHSVA